MRDLLFEVPVYRVPIEAVLEEQRVDVERRLVPYKSAWAGLGKEPSKEQLEQERRRIEVSYWGAPYTYNEVVGWIQVRANGEVVKAYGYKVPQSRIPRGFRIHYQYIDKLFELWFTDETSEQIAAAIRDALLGVTRKGEPFAGRHVDLEAFDNIAPLLDWRDLLGLRPS